MNPDAFSRVELNLHEQHADNDANRTSLFACKLACKIECNVAKCGFNLSPTMPDKAPKMNITASFNLSEYRRPLSPKHEQQFRPFVSFVVDGMRGD